MRGLDDLVRAGKVCYVGISDAPAWVVSQANTMAQLRGWSPFVGLQIEYSLIERTVERELLPMSRNFGISVAAWAPIGGGILTGKYSRGDGKAEDSKRSQGNQRRLTETNLAIARAVDKVADDIGATSAQVATAWTRSRFDNVIPIVGARKLVQIQDLLGSAKIELSEAHRKTLDEVSAIELGFPHGFIRQDNIRKIVFGDMVDRIDLPELAQTD
jgi:aryl-alcohol dehydrogenase-like predicted oxidoreductase